MKVELLKPHTDAGREYQPGAAIELSEQDAHWLIQTGTARAAPAPAEAKKQEK